MKEITTFEAHTSYILGLTFTKNGKTLISSGMDNHIKLWSAPGWDYIRTFEGHANSVNSFALSPDEDILVSSSSDNTIKIWSFPDGKILSSLQDRKKVVSSVQISADGNWVIAGSYGGRVSIWTVEGEPVTAFKASQKNLTSAALSPDGAALATAGLGDDIHLWSMPSCEPLNTLTGHETAVGSLEYIDQGDTLVSVGYEGTIRFWDTTTWTTRRILADSFDNIRGITFSPDERLLAVSVESQVRLYETESLALQYEIPVSTKVINGIAFSPDGDWLALGAADKKIRIWEMDR